MKVPTTIALSTDIREGLDRLAAQQERTRSWIAERALQQFLASQAAPAMSHTSDAAPKTQAP